MRHRLERGDAEALPMRRAGDDRRPRVETGQLLRRDEPARHRHPLAERPVTGDDEVEVARRLDELEDPLLPGEPTGVEHLGRPRLGADLGRKVDAARDDLDLPGAEPGGLAGERRGRAHDRLRPAEHRPCQSWRTPGESDVRPPELDDERLPRRHRRHAGRKPVRVDEVGVARRPPRGPRIGGQERRHERGPPRLLPQVADDPGTVRQAEVRKGRRRDDLDLRARLP